MAKYFQVKVYNKAGTYLTTWKDVVTNIEFNNEINSAGGQMKLTLARNAGDYGEGSDVDFGHRVKVYVFDKEEPNGLLLFQGFISGYTPIYKNDKVDVTILSYGAELTDFILEGGEGFVTSQTSQTSTRAFGGSAPYTTQRIAQTFTAPTTHKLSRLEVILQTLPAYDNTTGVFNERLDVGCIARVRTGTTIDGGSLLGTSSTFYIQDGTARITNIIFDPAIQLTTSSTYHIIIEPLIYASGSDNHLALITEGTGYSGGSTWYEMQVI